MGKLALGPVPTTSLLFPATAEFRLVETQLPVVRARTGTTRGRVLSDSGGRGCHPTVGRGGTNKSARVLALELPSHQLRSSKVILCVRLWWVELVGKHGESGSAESGWRIHPSRELREIVGEKLLQRSGFTERSGIRGRMLMGRTEGLSLDSGNSRILWHDHIVKLLCVSGGKSWHGVREVGRARHDILELLIEGPSGLGLAELNVR